MFILVGLVVLGAALVVGALAWRIVRPPSGAGERRRRVLACYALQERYAATSEADLVKLLERSPGLITQTTSTFEARMDLLALVKDRRHQVAIARWADWRPRFVPHVPPAQLEEVDAILSDLAERMAVEDFEKQTRARLIEIARAHPYFASFTRRSPPGVRRFFELLNKGRHPELLQEWPEIVAAWWEDEGAPEQRRSLAIAPELRGLVIALVRLNGRGAA